MKAYTILLLLSIALVHQANAREPLFVIPFIGVSDLSMIGFWDGLTNGLWGEDLSIQFEGCLNGWPEFGEDIYDIVMDAIEIADKPNEAWEHLEDRPDFDTLFPFNKSVFKIIQMT